MTSDIIALPTRHTTPSLPDSLRRLVELPVKPVFGEHGFERNVESGVWRPPAGVSPAVREEANRALAAFERYLTPAEPQWIAGRVAALLAHFWVGAMPSNLQAAIARDWIDLLGEFPAHAVETACRDWLRMETKKPMPAQIRSGCWRAIERERRVRDRLAKLAQLPAA